MITITKSPQHHIATSPNPLPSPAISTFVLGVYETNCFVVTVGPVTAKTDRTDAMPCWIVDCGLEPDEMLDWIERQNLAPTQILLTHAHLDHIAGVDRALSRFGRIPIAIHEAEIDFCTDPMLNLSALIGMPITCTRPDRGLKHGDQLTLAGTTWRVLHTPGHSPGGACFVHDESKQAIVGDTLFAGSIGRFDFPTSNADDLRHSIQDVLMALPDDTTIYPGHGEKTTIGVERRNNPYIRGGF